MDWAGLALLAFGVCAGLFRGFLHQSTRFLVLLLALVCAGLAQLLPGMLAGLADPGAPGSVTLFLARFSLGWFVVLYGAMLFGRRWLVGTIEAASSGLSRLGGALLGAAGALLLFLCLACSWTVLTGTPKHVDLKARPLAEPLISLIGLDLPSSIRPAFLDQSWFPRS